MTKVEFGSTTITSTGSDIIVLNDPTLVIEKIVLCVSSASNEAAIGYYDGSVTFTGDSTYAGENTTKSITDYKNVGGTKTKVFETVGTYVDTGEFGINTTTCSGLTKILFVAYGH